jgi:hypothetical protein
MMSIRVEEAERLAELLREIFALSKTNGPNHSKSAAADDSIKLAARISGITPADAASLFWQTKDSVRFWNLGQLQASSLAEKK